MRGLRSLLLLLVVLAGLAAYIKYGLPKSEDDGLQGRVFQGLESDAITAITVTNKAGETTTLTKNGVVWSITAPVALRGSDMEGSTLANAIAGLNQTRIVDEHPTDLKPYGLDPPKMTVVFTATGSAQPKTLYLGIGSGTGSSIYARTSDNPRVMLVPEYNDGSFNKGIFDLRDKAILSVEREKVDGIDVALGPERFAFARKGTDWALTAPTPLRADTSLVDGLATALTTASMTRAVAEATTPDALATYGLTAPSATFVVHAGTSTATLAIGRDADDTSVFARDAARPEIFTMAKTAVADLRKTAADYRRKELFDMKAFTARSVQITRNGATLALSKVSATKDGEKDTWTRTAPASGEADGDKVATLLAGLADVRATSDTTPAPRSALSAPVLVAAITFGDASTTERVTIGRVGDRAYARRDDEGTIVAVDAAKLTDLVATLDELLK